MGSVAKAISLDAAVATSFFFLSAQEEIFTSKEEQDHQQYNSGTKLNGFQKMNLKKRCLKKQWFANMPESLDRATGKQKHRGNKHDACLLARLQLFFFSPAHHQVMKS